MTRFAQWIVRPFFFFSCTLYAGCSSTTRSTTPARTPLELDAQTASALQTLERSKTDAANAIKAIDVARQVTLNNISNAQTTAFKKSRVNFEDLFYQTLKTPGTTSGAGDVSPSGISVGLGMRISSTQIDFSQGSLNNTGRPLDVGIQGDGFFAVQVLPTQGNGIAYTRNGNFFINNTGEIVVGMGDGFKLSPGITIPNGVANLIISTDGVVSAIKPGGTSPTIIGQIQLTQFINPQGLSQLGGSLYQETAASGPPVNSKPEEKGAGSLLQNFLEQSNVDLTGEMVELHYLERWRAAMLHAIGMPADWN